MINQYIRKSLLLLAGSAFALLIHGQDATQGRALGVVTKVDTDARQIILKPDTGAEVTVALDGKASFRRVAPGETSLANATTIALADIHTGDRVLARGKADGGALNATLIVVMSQGDIASKQAAERADWDKRGATGVVTEVGDGQITINVRTLAGATPLVIQPAANAEVRRYAPDSVKFADAKVSSLAEIRKGDQVRARGNKTPDGMTMNAEEIVSGQFNMIAGLVESVDAKENLVKVKNIETKKSITVKISPDSTVRKLPPPMAQLIANRLHGITDAPGGAPAGGPPAGPPGAAAPQAAAPGGRGFGGAAFGGGRGGGGRGGDLQSMLDRVPAIMPGDLMPGDAIIVSSTVGSSADQVTAIMLLAGVEAILTKPGTREMSLGSWNMGGGADLGGFGQ